MGESGGRIDIKGSRYCWKCDIWLDVEDLIEGYICPYCKHYPKRKMEDGNEV